MSDELSTITQLLDVETGEVLPATIDNAAAVLHAARAMKQKIDGVILLPPVSENSALSDLLRTLK